MNKVIKSVATSVAVASSLAFMLSGCGDDNTTTGATTADSPTLTLSGRVVDGDSRLSLSGAKVLLKADGTVKTDITDAAGDFSFASVSKGSDYIIEVQDGSATDNVDYATYTTNGTTTSSGITKSDDLGALKVYPEGTVTVELRDAATDLPLTGFFVYTDPLGGSLGGLGEVLATDTNGSYSFKVPADGNDIDIELENLKLNGTTYSFADPSVTTSTFASLSAGESDIVYLTADVERIYQLQLHIVDDAGADTTLPFAVLPVTNTGTATTMFAQKVSGSTSDYLLELTRSDIVGGQFSFTVANFDSNDDGFVDTAARHIVVDNTAFTFDNGSFVSNVHTTPIIITSITGVQNINVETLSDLTKVYTGADYKLVVGFDRPVQVVSTPQMQYNVLGKNTNWLVNAETPADVFDANDGTGGIIGAGAATLNTTTGEYTYNNNIGGTSTSGSVTDTNGQLASPYHTEYNATMVIDDNVSYAFRANNTILEITLPNATLKEQININVSVQLEGTLDDMPRFVYTKTVTPIESAGLSSLNDLTIDDADHEDTQAYDVELGTGTYLTDQAPHIDAFTSIPDYFATTVTSYIRHLIYANTTASSTTLPSAAGTRYIVSPVRLVGTAKIVSLEEEYRDAGVNKTKTHDFFNAIIGFNDAATAIVTPDASDTLATSTATTEAIVRLDREPANHLYIGAGGVSTGFNTVYGGNAVLISGFDVPQVADELYYIYQFNLPAYTPATGSNNTVKAITLEIDVVGGTGSALAGTKKFLVK